MVRLLQQVLECASTDIFVSIPQWCDCCFGRVFCLAVFLSEFQSHNGAIAAVYSALHASACKSCFNPTMVRLLPSPARTVTMFSTSFNPTIVRLLLSLGENRCPERWFQSHNGAIAAC